MVVKEIIYKRLSENEIKDSFDGEYWPSQIWNCVRKQYYDRMYPVSIGYESTRFTVLGSALHELIADLLKEEQGINVISEVPIRIPHPSNSEIVFSGRADDIIIIQFTKERYIVEVKSVDDLQDKLRKGFLPKLEHRAQLNMYLRAYPRSHGILLYVDRSNFEMEEIPMNFDQDLYNKTLERSESLHGYLLKRETPPPEAKQNQDMSWQCKYCVHKARCDREQ
ncbi:PD-(D/E)XK nuclease family protein [Sulfuracidifex tepidarius]|uniref:CRISPR-associated exonuclease Cas4 n=1 Tax=Sulfuracidifex tepidarius TaxID=1294262 RepID=A0A510E4Q0_9CREN|nr:PD-(D/E)XK nuclease family protein [Sulfuracidifex tepidarius]BBG27505.1 CRISPR-associated exonuclease Cas4 [Sulfuracidifex tepidarius]